MTHTIPLTSPAFEHARIIERPDGFYWQSTETGENFGPFATLLDATFDMQSEGEGEEQSLETLAEAEASLDLSDWIDPDTGSPAQETAPRIEEH